MVVVMEEPRFMTGCSNDLSVDDVKISKDLSEKRSEYFAF